MKPDNRRVQRSWGVSASSSGRNSPLGAGWQLWPKTVGLSDSFDLESDSFLAPRRKARLRGAKTHSKYRGKPKKLKVKPPEIGEIVFLLETLVKELTVWKSCL